MVYDNIYEGIFVKRLNRFIAIVIIEGKEETVHVKNTGRCKELLIKGVKVYLQKSDNSNRKTKYSIISVYKGEKLINIDSQVPNKVVIEALKNNSIDLEELQDLDLIKGEVKFENSRFDIYAEKDATKIFIEVKGVTLEENRVARFPDAPTERGRKHLEELIKAKERGYLVYAFFLIEMSDVDEFRPNRETDKKFADTLKKANDNGVKVICYNCNVTKNTIQLKDKIRVLL